jgi:gluconokinase
MIVIVMGVVGAGKTTVGTLLAHELGWEFVDSDTFHSPSNIEKIRQGLPLSDADRAPWLKAIHDAIVSWLAQKHNIVLACSALKRAYREQLCISSEVKLVYLKGSYELISERLRSRRNHFAPVEILASQFATLEEPEDAVTVDVSQTPEEIVTEIRRCLDLL